MKKYVHYEQIENSWFVLYIEKLIIEEKEIKIEKIKIAKQKALFDTNFEKIKLKYYNYNIKKCWIWNKSIFNWRCGT